MDQPLATYAAFWPYYLREHSNPKSRALHYLGSTLAIAFLAAGLVALDWRYIGGAVIAGYFWAWIGHFFIEHNRPATFSYPLWSLASDFRMCACWLTGTLPAELAAAGIEP